MNRRSRISVCIAGLLAGLAGCESNTTTIQADSPQATALLELILPRSIEIQRYLTKPHSFDATGDANGVEVLLATRDSGGDEVKSVGTFTFELFARRMASGDPYGQRFGLWTISINSGELLKQYWDRPSKFYKFPLQLDSGTLPPGKYILTAQFAGPAGDKLFDEYSFTHGSGATGRAAASRDADDAAKR